MGRVAIVTGGTRGIGRAISEALHGAGFKVAANYGGNDEVAERCSKETGIPCYKFDVSDFAACQAGVRRIANDLGPVEVLVNNAGITRDGTLQRMNFEQWNQVIQTNLGSCFNMSPQRHRLDARAGLRPHRQYRLDQRPGGPVRPGQLRRRQIGHPRLHQGAGAGGARRRASPSTPSRRATSIPRWSAPCRRTSWRRSSRAFRSAGSARPRRSPAACSSSSPTMPASSPARRCRSTAASICTEPAAC